MDRPDWSDGRTLLTGVVGPALVLWGVLVGIGFVIAGPLSGPLRAEAGVDKYLAADRSHTWNVITLVLSQLGGTEVVIGASLVIGALTLWRIRDWRLAAVPAIAILIETAIFLSIASLIDRQRPPVAKLDVAPPTSSCPSGHVGASTALYLAFAFLALRIQRAWLRWTTVLICLATPLLVASPACTAACTIPPTSLPALPTASSVRCSPTTGIAIRRYQELDILELIRH